MINYIYSQKLKFEQLFVDIPLTRVGSNSPSIIRVQYMKYLIFKWELIGKLYPIVRRPLNLEILTKYVIP